MDEGVSIFQQTMKFAAQAALFRGMCSTTMQTRQPDWKPGCGNSTPDQNSPTGKISGC